VWISCGSFLFCAQAAEPPKTPEKQESEFYVLKYSYVPDILEKRGPHREEHLAAARKWGQDGKLIVAGALQEPVDEALFVWRGATLEEIKAFVAADPYVINGLVADSVVRPLGAVVPP